MYYGHYDDDGKYLGFYTPEIHCGKIPIYNTEPIIKEVVSSHESEDEADEEPQTITHEPGTVIVGEEWDLSTIPTPNIEMPEQEWREALTGDYKVIDGKHTYSPPPEPTAEEIINSQLTALDAEYQAQFTELAQALGLATLDNNTELIAEIHEEYAGLKTEYQVTMEVITNGKS